MSFIHFLCFMVSVQTICEESVLHFQNLDIKVKIFINFKQQIIYNFSILTSFVTIPTPRA